MDKQPPAPTPSLDVAMASSNSTLSSESDPSPTQSYYVPARVWKPFETKFSTFSSADLAKEFTNLVRTIVEHGSRQRDVFVTCHKRIRDLITKMANKEAEEWHHSFSTAHNHRERRAAYKLPLLDVDGGDEEAAPTSPHSATSLTAVRGSSPRHSLLSSPSMLPPNTTNTTDETYTLIPIQNHRDFPLFRIQEIQAQYYPSTTIVSMYTHLNASNKVTLVTADLENGPVDHLLIRTPHIISSLGLHKPPYDVMTLYPSLRVDETYKIFILSNQNPQNPKEWIVGELVPARHAFLEWLDERQCADPKGPPTITEARAIARRTRRRAWDVMREIEGYWYMERGSGGIGVRERRRELFGEDPVFEGGGDGRSVRGMWA